MKPERPLFSVVIPTCSRPHQLKNCLQSLAKLDYPDHQFEVILVDDGNEIPLAMEDYWFLSNLTVLRQENRGPATARNKGAFHAKGKYLIFTDDDCALAPDYLSKLEYRTKDDVNALMGGLAINALPNNLYAIASQQLADVPTGYGKERNHNHS